MDVACGGGRQVWAVVWATFPAPILPRLPPHPGDYAASSTRLPCGTLLLGRFELAVESDFTVYRRSLCTDGAETV